MQSIITDREDCFLCSGIATENHHCLFGKNRKLADKYGLTVRLCRTCHNNVHNNNFLADYLKREAQFAFEDKVGTREEFRKIFGRSYLSWQE